MFSIGVDFIVGRKALPTGLLSSANSGRNAGSAFVHWIDTTIPSGFNVKVLLSTATVPVTVITPASMATFETKPDAAGIPFDPVTLSASAVSFPYLS